MANNLLTSNNNPTVHHLKAHLKVSTRNSMARTEPHLAPLPVSMASNRRLVPLRLDTTLRSRLAHLPDPRLVSLALLRVLLPVNTVKHNTAALQHSMVEVLPPRPRLATSLAK